jgi:hypothetical protein
MDNLLLEWVNNWCLIDNICATILFVKFLEIFYDILQ